MHRKPVIVFSQLFISKYAYAPAEIHRVIINAVILLKFIVIPPDDNNFSVSDLT